MPGRDDPASTQLSVRIVYYNNSPRLRELFDGPGADAGAVAGDLGKLGIPPPRPEGMQRVGRGCAQFAWPMPKNVSSSPPGSFSLSLAADSCFLRLG
jgi:hypothetical protein